MLFDLTWVRLRGFLRTAGGIIVVTVIAVWLLTAMPVRGGDFGEVEPRDSVYGELSAGLAPVFAPAGFDDWHTSAALITVFVAKEAVISTWAQTYSTAQPTNESEPGILGKRLQDDFERTSGGHTSAAVLAFMVLLLAYTPCVATLAAQKREIGLRWTIGSVGLNLVAAWTVAVVVFQIGSLVT
jgi:ferrous iron transport protein B